MICPNCEGNNELTWKHYLLTITDRNTCSHCNAIFRVPRTFKHFVFSLMLAFALIMPILLIADLLDASKTMMRYILVLSELFVVFFVIVPLDKKYKNTKGKSVLVRK